MKFSIKLLSLFLIVCSAAYAADTASILPPAKTTFLDSNGKPLTAGTVDFYIPSTTTRKATWQDAGETILNTNPVTLDAAGRALILGFGSYRQVVKDKNGNIIWDQVTASAGSGSGGGGSTATGDGDLVGTIKPWAGMTAPNQYMFTYGQEVSRSTHSALLTAITSAQSAFCNSGNPIIFGLTDTTNFNIGVPVEISCVAGGLTTITAKTATTVTLALTPNVTTNVIATFFPWGNGNHSTTFNLPDYRGIVPIGNNNMGGVASTLSSTYFGTNPNSVGATGGSQSTTIVTVNFPPYTPAGIITNGAITSTFTGQSGQTGLTGAGGSQAYTSGGFASSQIIGTVASSQATSTFAGGAQGGTSTPFSRIMPSQTINFIVKVTPDTNSSTASGVTSLGTMTGDIACGTGLLCTGNNISVTTTSGVQGPPSSVIGNIAFWDNTIGSHIAASPVFLPANPAKASIYSQLANPANGYTTIFNGMQFSQGTPIPASQQFGANNTGLQQALVGTLNLAAGDTAGNAGYGVNGYCNTASIGVGCVGIGGFGAISIAGANAWGLNSGVTNCVAVVAGGCFNFNFMAGAEFNVNPFTTASGEPTGSLYGVYLAGGGDLVGPLGDGIFLDWVGQTHQAQWTNGMRTRAGAAVNAFVAGPLRTGASQQSQSIIWQSTNGASTVLTAKAFTDNSGSIYFDPFTSTTVNLRDGAGNTLLSTGTPYGGSGVKINGLATAGVTTNTSSGVLGTLAGTSTTLLHGNASGLPAYGSVSLTADVSGVLPSANGGVDTSSWTVYTPLLTASAGTPASASVTGRYKQIGKTIFLENNVQIATIGSASGAVRVTLPFTAAAFVYSGVSFEFGITAKSGGVFINSGSTFLETKDATGSTFWVNGYTLAISTTYEVP